MWAHTNPFDFFDLTYLLHFSFKSNFVLNDNEKKDIQNEKQDNHNF